MAVHASPASIQDVEAGEARDRLVWGVAQLIEHLPSIPEEPRLCSPTLHELDIAAPTCNSSVPGSVWT